MTKRRGLRGLVEHLRGEERVADGADVDAERVRVEGRQLGGEDQQQRPEPAEGGAARNFAA